VEPEVSELDDVFLYSVDDLSEIVKEGLDSRQGAVAQAEAIIDSNVINFMHWLESRQLVPTIRALRDQAEQYRRHELERAKKLLAKGEDPQKILESLSNGLTNKFLRPCHLTRSIMPQRTSVTIWLISSTVCTICIAPNEQKHGCQAHATACWEEVNRLLSSETVTINNRQISKAHARTRGDSRRWSSFMTRISKVNAISRPRRKCPTRLR
jgi:hypothetical protein